MIVIHFNIDPNCLVQSTKHLINMSLLSVFKCLPHLKTQEELSGSVD